MSKLLLQVVLSVMALIPVGTGIRDVVKGIGKYGLTPIEWQKTYDNDFRFSAGIWLMLGLATLYIIPHIERETKLFRLIMLLIITGGIGRLISVVILKTFTAADWTNLTLELIVCPMLILWQKGLG